MRMRGGADIPVVTVDSNIWYKDFPRYLIFHLQVFQVCEFQWSDMIWEECERSLGKPPTSLDDGQLENLYNMMVSLLGECHYLNTQKHLNQISRIKLADPKDAHVLYLAYLTGSHYLVTENLKHFPAQKVIKNKLSEVLSLDDFLCEMLEQFEYKFLDAISQTIADMEKKQETVEEILNKLNTKNECPEIRGKLDPHISYIEANVASLRGNPS